MNNFFVSITVKDGVPMISVSQFNVDSYFPLTKRGCLDAGKFLRYNNQESWMVSSSIDFPREYKKSFRYNVTDLMQEGYNSYVG